MPPDCLPDFPPANLTCIRSRGSSSTAVPIDDSPAICVLLASSWKPARINIVAGRQIVWQQRPVRVNRACGTSRRVDAENLNHRRRPIMADLQLLDCFQPELVRPERVRFFAADPVPEDDDDRTTFARSSAATIDSCMAGASSAARSDRQPHRQAVACRDPPATCRTATATRLTLRAALSGSRTMRTRCRHEPV